MENYESTLSQEFAHVQKKPGFVKNSGVAFMVAGYFAVVSASVGNIMKDTSSKPYQVSSQVEEVQSQFSKNLVEVYHQNGIEIDIPYDLNQKISFVSISDKTEFGSFDVNFDGSYTVGIDTSWIKEVENRESIGKFLNLETLKSSTEADELGSATYYDITTKIMGFPYDRQVSEMAGDFAVLTYLKNNIELGNVMDSLTTAIYLISKRENNINEHEQYSLSFQYMSDNFEIAFGLKLESNTLQELFKKLISVKENGASSDELGEIKRSFIHLVSLYEKSFHDVVIQNIPESQRKGLPFSLVTGVLDDIGRKTNEKI